MTSPNSSQRTINAQEAFTNEIWGLGISSKYDPGSFVPECSFSVLVNPSKIEALVPKASPKLVDFVCNKAYKVFLTIWLGLPELHPQLNDILTRFDECGFHNAHLPIDDITLDEKCTVYRAETEGTERKCQHSVALNVFHEAPWGRNNLNRFRQQQWMFSAPVFNEKSFKTDLVAGCILPFTSRSMYERDGHFGTVLEVGLRIDHQDVINELTEVNREAKEVRVALKRLKNISDQGYSVEEAWRLEADALNGIRSLEHPNLVRPITAFRRGVDHFIILEWAQGGNLREFWSKHGAIDRPLDVDQIRSYLDQLLGLTKALEELHMDNIRSVTRPPENPNSGTNSGRATANGLRAPTNVSSHPRDATDANYSQGGTHVRHGDLKPENILHFAADSTWLGTLKIADLGLAKVHDVQTALRTQATKTRHGTIRYEAPQVTIAKGTARSRLYDIWSMGCVIFESVIWLLYGYPGLETFWKSEDNITDPSRDSLYFTTDPTNKEQAKVSKLASSWIEQILDQDHKSNHRSSSLIQDLLALVRDKLLVVALGEDQRQHFLQPQQQSTGGNARGRINSRELVREMNGIFERAKQSTYLDSAKRRPRYPVPPSSQTVDQSSTPLNQQHFNDIWVRLGDDAFTFDVLSRQGMDVPSLFPDQKSALCDRCQQLDLWQDDFGILDTLSDLKTRSRFCDFCGLLLTCSEKLQIRHLNMVQVRRVRSELTINNADANTETPPVLSLCKRHDPKRSPSSSRSPQSIQIGFPRLPKIGSQSYFELIRLWLEDCDNHHSRCRPNSSLGPIRLPTRVIDVGEGETSGTVRLYETRPEDIDQMQPFRYIALSHRWGDQNIHKHFPTTTDNIAARRAGISVDTLPAMFRDAIEVTRQLGVKYLWIDSLCIIQEGDLCDFADEAKCMGTVFRMAYCVIAATHATGTSERFLGSQPERNFVRLERSSENPLYVCEAIDNFQHDIIDGPLNKRGWVLQERALARRTIHFAPTQTYWECGEGVRCETLTRMRNNQAEFLGDPNFPTVASKSSKGARIRLYESLYKQYSTLEFTRDYDRPLAIAGLEQRLITAFQTRGGYGVFQLYFRRGLLWRRASSTALWRIDQPPMQKFRVPSWSWMAYSGSIAFVDAPFDGVDWEPQLRSPWAHMTSSSSWHTADPSSRNELYGVAREFHRPQNDEDIVYDNIDPPAGRPVKCVVACKEKLDSSMDEAKQRHFVLLVAPKPAARENTEYERVGVGILPAAAIVLDGTPPEIKIF